MLPSASHSKAQSVLEKENLIKVGQDSVDKAVVEVIEVESGDDSESDNEEIIHPEVIKKGDVNLDDEFEKIVPLKFERLSEESSDNDNEIAEILNEAEPLGKELQTESEIVKPEIKSEVIVAQEIVIIKNPEEVPVIELKKVQPEVVKSEIKVEDKISDETISQSIPESLTKPEELQAEPTVAQSHEIKPQETFSEENLREKATDATEKSLESDTVQKVSEKIDSKPIEEEIKESSINDAKQRETIIDEKLVTKETPLSVETEHTEDKPKVPIQTYLWEDVKRAKEQVSGDNVCTPSVPFLQTKSLKVCQHRFDGIA